MPLDSEHCETFPVGVSIDVSSILPVKIGMLFAFNVLAQAAEHSFQY